MTLVNSNQNLKSFFHFNFHYLILQIHLALKVYVDFINTRLIVVLFLFRINNDSGKINTVRLTR